MHVALSVSAPQCARIMSGGGKGTGLEECDSDGALTVDKGVETVEDLWKSSVCVGTGLLRTCELNAG